MPPAEAGPFLSERWRSVQHCEHLKARVWHQTGEADLASPGMRERRHEGLKGRQIGCKTDAFQQKAEINDRCVKIRLEGDFRGWDVRVKLSRIEKKGDAKRTNKGRPPDDV
jgi:hypothetical protein